MKNHILVGRLYRFSNKGPNRSGNSILDLRAWVCYILYNKMLGMRGMQKLIKKRAVKYDYDNGDYVCCIGGNYAEKEIYPKRFFDDVIEVDFENIKVNIPSGYDEFLTQMYGDYMKLPPESARVSNHNFDAYKKGDV